MLPQLSEHPNYSNIRFSPNCNGLLNFCYKLVLLLIMTRYVLTVMEVLIFTVTNYFNIKDYQ